MPRPTPGFSVSDYHRQLRKWGCILERNARGGGHTRWVAPNGNAFTSMNESNSAKRMPTFNVIDQAAAAIGITRDQLLNSSPDKVGKTAKVVNLVAEEECIHNCNAPAYPCLCRKGRTHDGDHLCYCGTSWK
jgi:hypothetical protein